MPSVGHSRLALPFLVLAAAAAPLAAQRVEYAPGTARYRLTSEMKGTQSAMGNTTPLDAGLTEVVTIAIARPSKDTAVATVTLDSITMKGGGGQPALEKLFGARLVAQMSPTGKVYSSVTPSGITDPQLAQIMESLAKVLPSHRGTLAKGTTWTDTTKAKVLQAGLTVDQTSIATYRVAGDTTIDGQAASRVDRVMSVTATGSGNMQNTPVTMATTGSSKGEYYLTSAGAFLGASTVDDVDVKLTVVAQPIEISIKQNVRNRIEKLK